MLASLVTSKRVDSLRGRFWAREQEQGPFHFQIGVVPVSLRCLYAPAMHDFRSLYAGYERRDPAENAINIDVIRTRNGRSMRRRYEVWADGTKRFTVWHDQAVLPHIEWAVNWQIMLFLPRYFEIHASVMEIDGQGVIFPAGPQSGKSTLAVGLLARGWRYLSDEFALIDPDTFQLHPYPKALCIKEGSFAILDQLGLGRESRRDYVKGEKGRVTFVSPKHFGPESVGDPCPVRHIVFCRYRANESPSVKPISRAEAVLRLNRQSFNFDKFRRRGIEIMSNMVRGVCCYELAAGPIGRTCDLVETIVRGFPQRP